MTGRARTFVALSALALACNGGADTSRDQDEAMCDAVGEAGTSVVASTAEVDAPNLAVDGGPYTLTLVPNTVQYVTLTLVDAGKVLVYVDLEDVLTGLKTEGEQVRLVQPDENPYCPEDLPEVYEIELEAGSTVLRLGPADVTEVWVQPVTPG